jgi:hypothetical protein
MNGSDGKRVEFRETGVPLDEIEQTAEDVIELYGGAIHARDADTLHFSLPSRRGVAASGVVACTLRWSAEQEGTLVLTADENVMPGKLQRILLLVVGVSGALLWMLWPFFPDLGPLAWMGGAVAFATYFMTLRKTSSGIAADLLQRLARAQRDD